MMILNLEQENILNLMKFKFGFKEFHMWVNLVGKFIYLLKNQKRFMKAIVNEEKEFKLVHAGAHSMDIMRMEKGYLHWGHDISPAENPYEANLDFATKLNKKEDFVGKDYLIKEKIYQVKK